jgi:hypothetical protein
MNMMVVTVSFFYIYKSMDCSRRSRQLLMMQLLAAPTHGHKKMLFITWFPKKTNCRAKKNAKAAMQNGEKNFADRSATSIEKRRGEKCANYRKPRCRESENFPAGCSLSIAPHVFF